MARLWSGAVPQTSGGDLIPGLARFNADGTPDTTFGTSGQVLPTFAGGLPPTTSLRPPVVGVIGLVLRPDGAIDFETTVEPAGNSIDYEIAVGQLTASGSFDPTFGTGGQVLLSNTPGNYGGGLAIQADGKLIVAGGNDAFISATNQFIDSFDVYRLNADGTADTTFGTMGEATPQAFVGPTQAGDTSFRPEISSILIRPDGSILLGGSGGANDLAPASRRSSASTPTGARTSHSATPASIFSLSPTIRRA